MEGLGKYLLLPDGFFRVDIGRALSSMKVPNTLPNRKLQLHGNVDCTSDIPKPYTLNPKPIHLPPKKGSHILQGL